MNIIIGEMLAHDHWDEIHSDTWEEDEEEEDDTMRKITVDIESEIGKFVKQKMDDLGIKDEHELAKLSGLNIGTIRDMLMKDRALYDRTIKALAEALKCQSEEIKAYTGEKETHTGALCWYCMKAVPTERYGCSWSRNLIPVKGCEMRKGRVITCPEYKEG